MFIKLTYANTQQDLRTAVYVNMALVRRMHAVASPLTRQDGANTYISYGDTDGDYFSVCETPEQILDMLEPCSASTGPR